MFLLIKILYLGFNKLSEELTNRNIKDSILDGYFKHNQDNNFLYGNKVQKRINSNE